MLMYDSSLLYNLQSTGRSEKSPDFNITEHFWVKLEFRQYVRLPHRTSVPYLTNALEAAILSGPQKLHCIYKTLCIIAESF